jgi:hypothetical protein
VALIGLARPSAPGGEETGASIRSVGAGGEGVLEKTWYPESPVVQAIEESQEQAQSEEKAVEETKRQEQTQAQEEQEKKKSKRKPVVVTVKEGEKDQSEILIEEGDVVKTIVVDKPVIIKEGKEGKVVIVTPGGKAMTVLEGHPVHLEIVGDELKFIKEGKILKVGKDGTTFYVVGKPDVDVSEAIKVALKNVPFAVKVAEIATPHITWVAKDQEKEIREKVRVIREKLKAVEEKKLELREVDEALADLERDLEKMSRETSRVAIRRSEKPHVITIEPERVEEGVAVEIEPDIEVDIAGHAHKGTIKVIADKSGSFVISYQIESGEKGREAYEKAVARVKKDLPEGYSLEPEFEEESGLVTLKISGPSGKGTPSELVQKVTKIIKEETKEKKE